MRRPLRQASICATPQGLESVKDVEMLVTSSMSALTLSVLSVARVGHVQGPLHLLL